jgi:hypothetical protein
MEARSTPNSLLVSVSTKNRGNSSTMEEIRARNAGYIGGLRLAAGRQLDELMVDSQNVIPLLGGRQSHLVTSSSSICWFKQDARLKSCRNFETFEHTNVTGHKEQMGETQAPLILCNTASSPSLSLCKQTNVMHNLLRFYFGRG